jgi:antitoxin component of MazEF toxin-antitoxin module
MPILRKITNHGDSRSITLPASWLRCVEEKSGRKLEEVEMEVDDAIIIKPYLANTKEAQ